MEPIVAVLSRFGVRTELEESRLRVLESTLEGAGRVTTGVWPGFPSDMVSLVTVLATQAAGARSSTTGSTSCGSSPSSS